jgi:hypothetical protein
VNDLPGTGAKSRTPRRVPQHCRREIKRGASLPRWDNALDSRIGISSAVSGVRSHEPDPPLATRHRRDRVLAGEGSAGVRPWVEHMLQWVESQTTPVITLVLLALCYALAAIIFVVGLMISRRPIAVALKTTTPVMLTPLGVLVGLLIAFLASRVWTNLDKANAYVAQEASAIRESVLLADNLPQHVGAWHFPARRADSTDDWDGACRSAYNQCRQLAHLFNGGSRLSRAPHGSRSTLRHRRHHPPA